MARDDATTGETDDERAGSASTQPGHDTAGDETAANGAAGVGTAGSREAGSGKPASAKKASAKEAGGKPTGGKAGKAKPGKKKTGKAGKGEPPREVPAGEARPPARRRIVLAGISSRTWEHPADRGALTALRELRGFDEVLKALSGMWNERAWRLQYLGGAIRVDHRQHPRVYRLFAEAAASLDVASLPELYVQLSPHLNASCVGMSRPFIVVTNRAVEALDDDELRYILGHELGHLLSGHAVYRTMMAILTRLSANLAWLPAGSIVLRGIIVALHEWWRKAELSADRAGLLAGQDPSAALRAHMKLAGGGDLSEVDTTAFLEQAAEYESAGDLRESLIKLRMNVFLTHPLPVARAADLRHWIDSGHYARVLAGDYPRRDTDADASVSDDVKAAADSYRDEFRRSQDPLVGLLRKLGDGASGLGDVVGAGANRVRGWMGGSGNGDATS